MKIEINLKSSTLRAESLDSEQINKIIDGFFTVLEPGVRKEELQTKEEPKLIKPTFENKVDNSKNISKKLPIIDTNKTMSHNPFEQLKDKLETNRSNIRVSEEGQNYINQNIIAQIARKMELGI